MKIIFNNSNVYKINPVNNGLSAYANKIFKHLSNIDIPFRYSDNPYYIDKQKTCNQLIKTGEELGIDVDKTLLSTQSYLNYLHQLYEKNYDGKNIIWLDFHEAIHLYEDYNQVEDFFYKIVKIDFRESGGLLKQKFNEDYYDDGTTKVLAGDCYFSWSELAKNPQSYYDDKEPDELVRVIELCKPWIWIKPSIRIAVEDIDFETNTTEMMKWFSKYEQTFIETYGLKKWKPEHMFTVIPFGKLENVELFKNDLQNGNYPKRLSL